MSDSHHNYIVYGDDATLWSLFAHGAGHSDDQVDETEQVLRVALDSYGTAAERWRFRQQLHPVNRYESDPARAVGVEPQWWNGAIYVPPAMCYPKSPGKLEFECQGPVAYGTEVARLLTVRYDVTVVHIRVVQCACDAHPATLHPGCVGSEVELEIDGRMETTQWRSWRCWQDGELVDQRIERRIVGKGLKWHAVHWLEKPAFIPV